MAAPAELYDALVNRYVADFVGQSNFFAGQVAEASATEATGIATCHIAVAP